MLDKVVGYERALAAYTQPSFAIVHSEYLVNEVTEEIYVVESALRGGGVYISSDLIPLATGIDINGALLDMALGEAIDIEAVIKNREDKASGYVCFYLPDGTFSAISGVEKVRNFPFVRQAFVDNIEIGKKTERMTYKGARKGPILVSGKNREELERNISIIQDTLRVEVIGQDGRVYGIIWD